MPIAPLAMRTPQPLQPASRSTAVIRKAHVRGRDAALDGGVSNFHEAVAYSGGRMMCVYAVGEVYTAAELYRKVPGRYAVIPQILRDLCVLQGELRSKTR